MKNIFTPHSYETHSLPIFSSMKLIQIISSIFLVLVALIVLPKIVIKDADHLNEEEIMCAKRSTEMILENPIERGLIIELSVDAKKDDIYYTSAYTLGGLKYATVELHCDSSATVTWRRWFGSGK